MPKEISQDQEILQNWYECAPYGEQIPKDLPKFLAELVNTQGGNLSEEEAYEIILNSSHEHPWSKLFELIFTTASRHTLALKEDDSIAN